MHIFHYKNVLWYHQAPNALYWQCEVIENNINGDLRYKRNRYYHSNRKAFTAEKYYQKCL